MRILMISEFYPPLIGGTEIHVWRLAHELVRRGHHVAVATLEHKGSPAFENDEGVHVYRISGWHRILTPFYEDATRMYHPPLPDPGVMTGLRRVVKQEQPDIVHATKWMSYSFAWLKSWSKAKFVITMHDYSLCCPTVTYLHNGQVCTGPQYLKCLKCAGVHYGSKGKTALLTTGLKLSSHLHRYIDKYIAVSTAVRDACKHVIDKPIEVVPNFIADTVLDEAYSIERPAYLPPQDNYILFVGRQNGPKGLDVLLEAYSGLSDLAPLVLMLSDFGETPRKFPAGVTVVYNVPHAQVMRGWMHCAVAAVPSIWPEPFGLVIIEAMMCGKPVVASAVGGIPDIILNGESGLLVKPGDADALRGALRELLLDPDRRARMGSVGRQRVRQFAVDTVIDRIEQIYIELLESHVDSPVGVV